MMYKFLSFIRFFIINMVLIKGDQFYNDNNLFIQVHYYEYQILAGNEKLIFQIMYKFMSFIRFFFIIMVFN